MAFILYLAVLLVSAASVLFGLDLITSPLSSPPNVPIGRSVQHVARAPAVTDTGERQTRKQALADDRELTPVYPARPGPSAPLQTNGTAASDETVTEPAPADQTASVPPAPDSERVAAVQPALREAQMSCDVQACGSAYRSFRSTDCTYQPSNGARRICEKSANGETAVAAPLPPAPKQALKPDSKPEYKRQQAQAMPIPRGQKVSRQKRDSDELAEVVRIVRQQTASREGVIAARSPRPRFDRDDDMGEVERIVRKMTRGRDVGDIQVVDGQGRLIVVHTGEREVYR
jgi:hypothetical protein